MYNALEILNALKSNPNAMLWINSERKENAILSNVFIGALMGIAASFALFLPLVLQ